MTADMQRTLTPLSTEAIEALVPRLRGRTPIERADLRLSVLIPVYNEERTLRVILEQVRNGVAVRMAVLYLLAGRSLHGGGASS